MPPTRESFPLDLNSDVFFCGLSSVASEVHTLCARTDASLNVLLAFVCFLILIRKGNNSISLLYPPRRQICKEDSQRGGKSNQPSRNLPPIVLCQSSC